LNCIANVFFRGLTNIGYWISCGVIYHVSSSGLRSWKLAAYVDFVGLYYAELCHVYRFLIQNGQITMVYRFGVERFLIQKLFFVDHFSIFNSLI
jgi:hypothetical protein